MSSFNSGIWNCTSVPRLYFLNRLGGRMNANPGLGGSFDRELRKDYLGRLSENVERNFMNHLMVFHLQSPNCGGKPLQVRPGISQLAKLNLDPCFSRQAWSVRQAATFRVRSDSNSPASANNLTQHLVLLSLFYPSTYPQYSFIKHQTRATVITISSRGRILFVSLD